MHESLCVYENIKKLHRNNFIIFTLQHLVIAFKVNLKFK